MIQIHGVALGTALTLLPLSFGAMATSAATAGDCLSDDPLSAGLGYAATSSAGSAPGDHGVAIVAR